MKLFAASLALVLAACATKSPAPSEPVAAGHGDESIPDVSFIGEQRSPAATKEEELKAYRWYIVTSTKLRVDAAKRGDMATACNASKQSRGHDTMGYYLAFEILKSKDFHVTKTLMQELGPFGFRNYVQMEEHRAPIALHHACTSTTPAGKDVAAVKKAAATLYGFLIQE